MGQELSKATSRLASRLGSKAAVTATPSTRFTDPNAVLGGFQRGEGPLRDIRGEGQREFLLKQQQGHAREGGGGSTRNAPQEMPADLIQFLNDVGPLKKRLVKTRGNMGNEDPATTSSQDESTSRVRKKESMRLAERIEGFETERTTNFSNRKDTLDPSDFGVGDVLGLYSLLSRKGTGIHGSDEETAKSFYEELARDGRVGAVADKERARHQKLLQNALQHTMLPVVLKDTSDNSFIGAWPETVESMERLKIVCVPKTSVMLVLEEVAGTTG